MAKKRVESRLLPRLLKNALGYVNGDYRDQEAIHPTIPWSSRSLRDPVTSPADIVGFWRSQQGKKLRNEVTVETEEIEYE